MQLARVSEERPRALAAFEGIDAALASKVLAEALAHGGDEADVFVERVALARTVLEDGRVRTAERDLSQGAGVRVRRGEGAGYAHVESLAPAALLRAARTARTIAEGGRSVAPVGLEERSVPRRYDPGSSLDARAEAKRELLRRADVAARAVDPAIARVEVTLDETLREITLATHEGVLVRDRQPLIRFGVRVIAERGGRRAEGKSGGGGRRDLSYFDERSPEWHAREAAREALAMLEARPAPAGTLDVVIAPGQGGVLLHEAVGHGLEADFHRKGTSRYAGRVGQKVASPLCTVVDDACPFGARGSIAVDDEGVVPEAVTLIEGGVLRATMNDRFSAARLGDARNGHGRRESFRHAPMPRMTNTLLLAGPHDPEEIRRSVRRGLYVQKIRGGEVAIESGDFVFFVAEGYWIEDGRLGAPVSGVSLVGNGPDVMERVTMLGTDFERTDGTGTCGKDGQSVPVGVGCPTMKIAGMTVGGSQIG